ncbi:MAG: hypothetical protein J6X60_13980 [Ruminiclostridium sp.]|nr:hypothetical protein [Ruminiclostridium sp.]
MKVLIIAAIVLYIISPIDAVPGVIDDIIVALMGVGVMKGITSRGN